MKGTDMTAKDEIEELSEAFSPATIAGLTACLYETRKALRHLTGEEQTIAKILREHIERTGEPVAAEGLPLLELRDVGAGWAWDSEAVRKAQEHPEEWRRLVELGAVTIVGSVVKAALRRGQLAARPAGGIEKRQTRLQFREED